MTYAQAMEFWLGRVNYELRSAKPSDLKLDRMRALMDLLGNPHEKLRIVHIAGSKGKGSTAAMLDSILQQAGYRTGLFTSPHLVQVEERIQVDGIPIDREELVSLMEEIRSTCARKPHWPGSADPPLAESLTFFEIATALGFLHFVRRRVEVAVVEVGLGGRLDSTNVCQPLLAIITSISLDHTQQLGNTLGKIAMEKAGIVKPGRQTLSGARVPEAREVIEAICKERKSPLSQLGVDIHYRHEPARIDPHPMPLSPGGRGVGVRGKLPLVQVTTRYRSWPALELGLIGEHQAANAALALAAVDHLRLLGLAIEEKAVKDGLAQLRWPARLEVVGRQPMIVLDCAHNLASVEALLETLHNSFPHRPGKEPRRLLIFAGSRDKDLAGMLRLLAPHFDHLYLTRFTTNPRSLSPEKLAEKLPANYTAYTLCANPAQAWKLARAQSSPEDLICITGSVFLAGEMRPMLVKD